LPFLKFPSRYLEWFAAFQWKTALPGRRCQTASSAECLEKEDAISQNNSKERERKKLAERDFFHCSGTPQLRRQSSRSLGCKSPTVVSIDRTVPSSCGERGRERVRTEEGKNNKPKTKKHEKKKKREKERKSTQSCHRS
jgi:hypothetical protein